MYARFCSLIGLLTLFGPVLPAQEAAFQLYTGREVTGGRDPVPPDRDPLVVTQLLNSPLAEIYNSIRQDRSLILSDCGKGSLWCGNPAYAFPTVFVSAAKGLGLAADSLADSWYRSAIEDNQPFKTMLNPWTGSLSLAPFHLLAIVNRMDLARRVDGSWAGAEVRFVYGRTPRDPGAATPPYLTLILEFVLPERDWNGLWRLADQWRNVGTASDQDFPKALEEALKETRYRNSEKVRIRTNLGLAGPWQFTEWDLTRRTAVIPGKPLKRDNLEDEFTDSYVGAPTGSATYAEYLTLWKDITNISGPRHIAISSGFLDSKPKAYLSPTYATPLGTPQGFCATEPTRNALALERCTGCHSVETANMKFTHISNRLPTGSSTLSPFLVGAGGRASLREIYYATKGEILQVDVPYQTYKASAPGVCNQPYAATAHRHFYDVGRRALFLAAVLNAGTPPVPSDIRLVESFMTDYTH